MLTRLSLWGIYIASYLIDYLVILGISLWHKLNEYNKLTQTPKVNFLLYCKRTDYLIWVILIVLTVFSIICIRAMKTLPMNTRVKVQPEENIGWEISGYVLAQVMTILTILFSDYWVIVSLIIFFVAGVVFVNSKKVHYSPLFIIPMGYSVFQCENYIAITNYSKDGLRLAIENNPDGVEARELEDKIFLISK